MAGVFSVSCLASSFYFLAVTGRYAPCHWVVEVDDGGDGEHRVAVIIVKTLERIVRLGMNYEL